MPRDRRPSGTRRYPRSARVNEILREVLAEQLERMEAYDDRLGMLTITAVQCDPDLRHAKVLFSSLSDVEEEALGEIRVRLQAAVSAQVRLKRTPLLSFAADPAVANGQRIEDILRALPPVDPSSDPTPADPADHGTDPADRGTDRADPADRAGPGTDPGARLDRAAGPGSTPGTDEGAAPP